MQQEAPAAQAEVCFRREADEVFERLWANRVVSPSGGVGWLDHQTDGNSFGYLPFLYGMGEGGIAAFEAEYAQATQDPRAVQILHDYRKKIRRAQHNIETGGGAAQLGGLVGITGLSGCVKTMLMAARPERGILCQHGAVLCGAALQCPGGPHHGV